MSDSNTLINELKRLVALRAKATGGEWEPHDITDDGEAISRGIKVVGGKGLNNGDEYELFSEEDAGFIAAAGNLDLEGLLQLVYRLVDYKPTKDASFFWPKPQPIETAPKDGTMILGWCGDLIGWCGMYGQYHHSYGDFVWGDGGTHYTPTHWIPMPPAPD